MSFSGTPPVNYGVAAGVPNDNPFGTPRRGDLIGWLLALLGYAAAAISGWLFDQLLVTLVTTQSVFFACSVWVAIRTLRAIDRHRRSCHAGYERLCAMRLDEFARWRPSGSSSLLERACVAGRESARSGRREMAPIVVALTEPLRNRISTLHQLGEAATSFGMLGTMFGILLPLQMLSGLAGQGVAAIADEMLGVLGAAALAVVTTILGAANSVVLLGLATIGAARLDRLESQLYAQASLSNGDAGQEGPRNAPAGDGGKAETPEIIIGDDDDRVDLRPIDL